MKSSNNIYLERVDILRFLAATLVIFWHYLHYSIIPLTYVPDFFAFSILQEGHTGVSLFMVLSGFIFQYINNGKEINYPQFFKNRFFRIFPLALFWILLLVARDNLNSVEALLNTLFMFHSRAVPGVGWTIVVECQFYLIFPVLHKVIERKGGILNVLGLIAFMILLRCMLYVNLSDVRDFGYYSIFGRLDQFLIGMIAAKLYSSSEFVRKTSYQSLRLGLFFIVIITFLELFHIFNLAGGYHGMVATHAKSAIWIVFHDFEALFYALIITLFLSLKKYKILSPIETFFAKCGEFSYSMYWLHWPAIQALCIMMIRFGIGYPGRGDFAEILLIGFVIIVPVIVFLSALSYNFFEKPFLQFRNKYDV